MGMIAWLVVVWAILVVGSGSRRLCDYQFELSTDNVCRLPTWFNLQVLIATIFST